ncbi:MAG TPA: transketolase C-terminal domain-containing protein [Kiritimatiellia bacterium]|nr:transketolase C-terminal domain-containing protein [Kiritimatiellia bacterium]
MAESNKDTDVRDAFFDEVYEAACKNRRIMVLTNDQGAFSLEKLKRDCPDQYINIGVAEQNLVNVAAGLALGGMRPMVYGITNFMSLRCCEQIAVSLCFPNLPVAIVASGGGLTYASDGPTHHAVQDIGVLRTMPNLAIYNPSDAALTRACARACLAASGPSYVRIEKGILPVLHAVGVDASSGFSVLKAEGAVLIVSTGFAMYEAAKTVDLLRTHRIEAGLLDLFRLKPVDQAALSSVLKRYRWVVVLEEQTPVGGAADLVARVVAEEGLAVRVHGVSLSDSPCYRYGSRGWLHGLVGLDAEAICGWIKEWAF